MATATLTPSAPSATLDTTPGQLIVLGISGYFGGGNLSLDFALAGSPTVFATLASGLFGSGAYEIRAPGSKLKATLANLGSLPAAASVNIEITAAA